VYTHSRLQRRGCGRRCVCVGEGVGGHKASLAIVGVGINTFSIKA
jgi:hypothetical protein